MNWQPGASLATLQARARLLAEVRDYFAAAGVLEVDTPVLAATTVTDPAIESLYTEAGQALQTSPEYFMKRLLAAGSGAIFQIARVFRAGERGRRHNPEFLMLEWYRPGFDDHALMAELDALCSRLLPGFPARRISFRTLLADAFGVDPLVADGAQLAQALRADAARSGADLAPSVLAEDDPQALLDLAYAQACDRLAGACFVHDFPPAQAALARLRRDARGDWVAARFELIVDGVELANGYHELADADEQRRRFEADRARRAEVGQRCPAVDERLLAALAAGLPNCAGVALGLDRLLMLQIGAVSLDAVMPFSAGRCD